MTGVEFMIVLRQNVAKICFKCALSFAPPPPHLKKKQKQKKRKNPAWSLYVAKETICGTFNQF